MALNLINMNVSDVLGLFKESFYAQYGTAIKIGSEEFAVSSVFAYCMNVLFNAMNVSAQQRFVDTADGEFLDAIAHNYGIESRPGGEYADCACYIQFGESYAPLYDEGAVQVSDASGHVFVNSRAFTHEEGSNVPFRAVEMSSDYNNIPMGQLNTLINPPYGIVGAYNLNETGGGLDADAYENDDLFRVWLKNEIASYAGAGTAMAYKGKAMNVDSRILDVFVLEQGMLGYERGKVKVYVLVDEEVTFPTEIVSEVQTALEDRAFRPIGDRVETYLSIGEFAPYIGDLVVTYPLRFSALAQERTTRVCNEYLDYLRQKINRPFVYGEIVSRLMEKDSDGVHALEALFTGVNTDAAPIYPSAGNYLSIPDIPFTIRYDEGDA